MPIDFTHRPSPSNRRPKLCLLVPSYNRAAKLAELLGCLASQCAGCGDDVVVMVSDNASPDDTGQVLEQAVTRHPWLRYHRQPVNLGAEGNMQWLVRNAPDAEYLWLFGDDDLLEPGAIARVLDLLAAEAPAWLFLPHQWFDADRRPCGGSPVPPALERHATPGDLYRAWTHWLTFISATILRAEAMREAVDAIETQSAYAPFLWFFRAGGEGPCLVADACLLHGSSEISWGERRHLIMTLDFTSLHEEGLHTQVSAEEFGASLDTLYVDGFGLDLWEQVPVERLSRAVARFPHSRSLRRYLWEIARRRGASEALPVLDAAARAAGADTRAAELVAHGEAAFAAGDTGRAIQSFQTALAEMPTCVPAWNDLAVVLHGTGQAGAAQIIENALFASPDDLDSLVNRAAILLAQGDRDGARADAQRACALYPESAEAGQVLALTTA